MGLFDSIHKIAVAAYSNKCSCRYLYK